MMVLRRKAGDVICIGDDIRVVVQAVQEGRVVRFGIEAPADVPVHRLEIYEQIQAENRAAGGAEVLNWLRRGSDDADSSENR